jgi:hypothetical protein
LCILFYTTAWTVSQRYISKVAKYQGSYFIVVLPDHLPQDNVLTLMAYSMYALSGEPRAQSYLVGFLPKKWSYVGIPFLDQKYVPDNLSTREIKQRIDQFSGSFYLLTSDSMMPKLYTVAQKFGLQANGECQNIYSDRQQYSNTDVLLCPVKKVISFPNKLDLK